MHSPSVPLEKLGFVTIGSFDRADPGAGHRTTLEVVELGERLGFDRAGVRNRTCSTASPPVAVRGGCCSRPI